MIQIVSVFVSVFVSAFLSVFVSVFWSVLLFVFLSVSSFVFVFFHCLINERLRTGGAWFRPIALRLQGVDVQ